MQAIRRFPMPSLFAVAVCLLFAVGQAYAVPVKGLYTVKTEVVDQSPEARRAALPGMMQEVVGRLVGEPDAQQMLSQWPALAPEFSSAERYLAQFLYQRVAGSGAESKLILRAEFEPAALNRLIQRNQLPQWGVDRPEVLVVLAWQGDGRREVLSSSPSSQLAAELLVELEQAAARVGVPIALPLMDLQDQRAVPEQELRAGFTDGLLQVAQRYGTDAVLFGRLRLAASVEPVVVGSNTDGTAMSIFAERGAHVDWSLLQQGNNTEYEKRSENVDAAMRAGFGMALRTLAVRYALAGESTEVEGVHSVSNQVGIHVLGVSDLAVLKRIEKHLAERTIVQSVVLRRLEGHQGERRALFVADLKGTLAKLEQAIAVGRLLQPVPKPLLGPAGDVSAATAQQSKVRGQEGADMAELWYRLR